MVASRYARRHGPDRKDQRTPAQRDRDRVLYCSHFRRLAEVTQVVAASEGHSFHNRLTHTLKVAQIARRLAEHLAHEQPEEAAALGGPDPEVCETAALAHDLGHPPFGHIAEKELRKLADDAKEGDGFEGNAQSFRIVTRLAVRSSTYEGLNLTAAALNAVLKYPWLRATKGEHGEKWGAYHSEKADFTWARDQLGIAGENRSVEAEIMDWADDIAYSVYDVDDFYRAGLIPLHQIFADPAERDRWLEDATRRLTRRGKDASAITDAFRDLVLTFPPRSLQGRFEGTLEQRALLRDWTSKLVSRYVMAIRLKVPTDATERSVAIPATLRNEVDALKQLVWSYVIESPRLLTQQRGERVVIRELFDLFVEEAQRKETTFDIFGQPHRQYLQRAKEDGTLDADLVRIIVDMISGLTEPQALRLHRRLRGISLGSIHDSV
jgi:dGTPase